MRMSTGGHSDEQRGVLVDEVEKDDERWEGSPEKGAQRNANERLPLPPEVYVVFEGEAIEQKMQRTRCIWFSFRGRWEMTQEHLREMRVDWRNKPG